MARDQAEFYSQDEPRTSVAARERVDHADRLSALDDDEDAQFLRTEKRVPVRRSPLPKRANPCSSAVAL